MNSATPKLDNQQLKAFDTEYYNNVTHAILAELLGEIGINKNVSYDFLDIGGGNGIFTDRIIESYPGALGTNVEYSDLLCNKNKTCDRKTILCQDALDVESYTTSSKHDVVFMNWFLHHLVSETYNSTIALQNKFIGRLFSGIDTGTTVFVMENIVRGYVTDNIASRLLYFATSSKALRYLTKMLGCNSAGVGVCYHDKQSLIKLFTSNGFEYRRYVCMSDYEYPLYKTAALSIHSVYTAFFSFKKA